MPVEARRQAVPVTIGSPPVLKCWNVPLPGRADPEELHPSLAVDTSGPFLLVLLGQPGIDQSSTDLRLGMWRRGPLGRLEDFLGSQTTWACFQRWTLFSRTPGQSLLSPREEASAGSQ